MNISFDLAQTNILFTDVDDTLTSEGQLLPETYLALWQLAEMGVRIIPVTGGCAGWCDQIIRTWPVYAVIGEGGAFYVTQPEGYQLRWQFWHDRAQHVQEQQAIIDHIRAQDFGFPIHFAGDQPFRFVDVAVDCRQQQNLSEQQIATVQQGLKQSGFQVRRSSIHLNVWQGGFDKCAMAKRLGHEMLGLSEQELKVQAVFIGDAPNDESMFEFFPKAVGVSNIKQHLAQMTYHPKCITTEAAGRGFAEFATAWHSIWGRYAEQQLNQDLLRSS